MGGARCHLVAHPRRRVLHSPPVSQRPQSGNGAQLVRVEFLDGRILWRPLESLDHGVLCRQFGVDPCTYLWDLPATAATRGASAPGRVVNGYVVHGRTREPIARVTFAWESERFRDVDPMDRRETLRLS